MNYRREGRGPFRDFDSFFERDFGPERMFRRHGGLKYYVLWLLSGEPMKGSEIMDKIQKQTMGWWRPSPGSIYPLLSSLEEEKLIVKMEDGKYSLTEMGREEIGVGGRAEGEGEWTAERIITEIEGYITYLTEISFDFKPYEERLRKIAEKLHKIIEGKT